MGTLLIRYDDFFHIHVFFCLYQAEELIRKNIYTGPDLGIPFQSLLHCPKKAVPGFHSIEMIHHLKIRKIQIQKIIRKII